MSAPTIEHETQILNKYVDHEKLKAKLLEKCGSDFDTEENIEVREDNIVIRVPKGKELTKEEIESLKIKRQT